MLSIADLGWGSVIGNTLDNGITYMPYGVDQRCSAAWRSCCRTASVMRTGMGAMAGNKAWHCYKRGLGPTPDQMFMQSNFGIVTKMGFWLMPEPEITCRSGCGCANDDDLGAADRHAAHAHARRDDPDGPADHERRAARRRCSRTAPTGATATAPIPEETLDGWRDELGFGRWIDALRALRGRGGRRPPLREDQGRVRVRDPGRRGLGHEVRAGGHRRPRGPARARPGRRPEPRPQRHDRLVRRRGGRPRRLLARRAAHRPRRASRSATSCAR